MKITERTRNVLLTLSSIGFAGGLTVMADSKYDFIGLTNSFTENQDTKRLEEISLSINSKDIFLGWSTMNFNDLEKSVYYNLMLKKEYDSLKSVLKTNGVEAKNELILKEKHNVANLGTYTSLVFWVLGGYIGLFGDVYKRDSFSVDAI